MKNKTVNEKWGTANLQRNQSLKCLLFAHCELHVLHAFFACKFTFCWCDFVPNLLRMFLWCDLEGRKGDWRGLKFILSMLWLFSIQGRFKGNRKWILNTFSINVRRFKTTLHLCHRCTTPFTLPPVQENLV